MNVSYTLPGGPQPMPYVASSLLLSPTIIYHAHTSPAHPEVTAQDVTQCICYAVNLAYLDKLQ